MSVHSTIYSHHSDINKSIKTPMHILFFKDNNLGEKTSLPLNANVQEPASAPAPDNYGTPAAAPLPSYARNQQTPLAGSTAEQAISRKPTSKKPFKGKPTNSKSKERSLTFLHFHVIFNQRRKTFRQTIYNYKVLHKLTFFIVRRFPFHSPNLHAKFTICVNLF